MEGAEEVNQSGQVAELHFAEQGVARMEGAEPKGRQKWGQGDPDEPRLIKGGETEGEQAPAQGSGQPGPEVAQEGHGTKGRNAIR